MQYRIKHLRYALPNETSPSSSSRVERRARALGARRWRAGIGAATAAVSGRRGRHRFSGDHKRWEAHHGPQSRRRDAARRRPPADAALAPSRGARRLGPGRQNRRRSAADAIRRQRRTRPESGDSVRDRRCLDQHEQRTRRAGHDREVSRRRFEQRSDRPRDGPASDATRRPRPGRCQGARSGAADHRASARERVDGREHLPDPRHARSAPQPSQQPRRGGYADDGARVFRRADRIRAVGLAGRIGPVRPHDRTFPQRRPRERTRPGPGLRDSSRRERDDPERRPRVARWA